MTTHHAGVVLPLIVRDLMVPLLLVFGVYVLIHGESSPGGGFQAGAIVAAAIILARLTLGDQKGQRFSMSLLIWMACIGLGVYMLGGILPLIFGANFLDYSAIPLQWFNDFASVHHTTRAMGIFIVEVGVFFGVASVLVIIYEHLTDEIHTDEFSDD